jgi:hypothetical protein
MSRSIIDQWLAGITEAERDEWAVHCKQNYHSVSALHAYLIERGVNCHVSTVYHWRTRNVAPGLEAAEINQENSEASGIDSLLVCNKLLANLHKVAAEYYRVIDEESDAISLNQAILSLPAISREMRAVAALVHGTNWQLDFESATMQGAVRAIEIMLASAKNHPEEPYIRKLAEGAILQLKEETKNATQKVVSH